MTNGTPILMLHRVGPVPLRCRYRGLTLHHFFFQAGMTRLARLGYQGISLADLLGKWDSEGTAKDRLVVVTFDDAYQSLNTWALPVLRRLRWRATIFVCSSLMGGHNFWIRDPGVTHHRLMSAEEVRSAAAEGFEIGSHTQTHVDLGKVDAERAWREIHDSRADLQKLTGQPVASFAYPFGSFEGEVHATMARKAGYSCAVTVEQGLAHPHQDRFHLPRVRVVSWRTTPSQLVAAVQKGCG